MTSAVALIPGAAQGSISAVTGTQVASRAHSGDLARRVDALQTQTGQGPCLDAVRYQDTVRVPDMAAEDRWPMFAPRALAAGAGSMLAFELYVDAENLGALNLFAHHAWAFDDESEHVGLLFAARTQDQLTAAMATRDLIGQAKGILMERFKITSDQAFDLLTQVSSQASRKVRDVAEELVHSGHRPHAHPEPPAVRSRHWHD